MTEHGKSQPRIYSELNDSHIIVHAGDRNTIAAGISMVNIAGSFVSPLRQRPDRPIQITYHNQPHVTERMVEHLRRLPVRESIDEVGLDAYCTFVVDVDNQGHVSLYTDPPAPQPGNRDHYEAFIERISRLYTERYGDLQHLPESQGMSIEDSLVKLAREHKGLMKKTGALAVEHELEGGVELQAILEEVEHQANPK